MVIEEKGDLLTCDADVICHQTNFEGVMGGGIALAIRNKMLTDSAYGEYVRICSALGEYLLGRVLFSKVIQKPGQRIQSVANCFCQNDYVTSLGGLTNYRAMESCLERVQAWAEVKRLYVVAVPGYMGCGIAGGDWDVVRDIIMRVFEYSPITCKIVYKA